MIERSDISEDAKIRLVLLYTLRYERMQNNNIKSLVDLLDRAGVSERKSAVCLTTLVFILFLIHMSCIVDSCYSDVCWLSTTTR